MNEGWKKTEQRSSPINEADWAVITRHIPDNFYTRLGVKPHATAEEMSAAFRRLAPQYHPDRPGGGNEAAFKNLSEAYNTLRNPKERERYNLDFLKEMAITLAREAKTAGATPNTSSPSSSRKEESFTPKERSAPPQQEQYQPSPGTQQTHAGYAAYMAREAGRKNFASARTEAVEKFKKHMEAAGRLFPKDSPEYLREKDLANADVREGLRKAMEDYKRTL